jgi:NitT/TauT family transport system ATP-binding protein
MKVTKRFGDAVVLEDFTLELGAGVVTALMGTNGAGKTTAARLLLDLEVPDAGEVTSRPGLRTAAVFQEDRLCAHLSAAANVRLVLERSRWDEVEPELVAVGLDADALDRPVRELSGGQRRRVAIARAVAMGSDLLVLDEPFAGIDAETKPAVVDYVRERIGNSAVLLITHDAADAAALDARIVRLGDGRGSVV